MVLDGEAVVSMESFLNEGSGGCHPPLLAPD
jgi:hypothetical protein